VGVLGDLSPFLKSKKQEGTMLKNEIHLPCWVTNSLSNNRDSQSSHVFAIEIENFHMEHPQW
jgi:hypothetical protein